MVTMTMPQLRYTSPQAEGKAIHGHGALTVQSVTKVVLVPSTLVSPPSTDTPGFAESEAALGVDGALGVTDRLEIYARQDSNSPLFLGAKYQLLGTPASNSRRDDLCLALLVGGGGAKSSGTDENRAAEIGGVAGHRLRSLFPYGAVYYSRYWADGTLRQGSDVYPFEGDGRPHLFQTTEALCITTLRTRKASSRCAR